MVLDLSIVIPAYNRIEMLKYSLESVSHAIQHLKSEVIVVDDGSKQPLEDQLQNFLNLPLRFIRQVNQGSIVARNRGLREASGKYLLFLDSDDLVHPDKLVSQVAQLESTGADISYTDDATVLLKGDYSTLEFKAGSVLPPETSAAKFYLRVQPNPSNPIYRRNYLTRHLTQPIVPENRVFDPVGDVWLYYNLAPSPAQIVKVDGHYSVYGQHDQERYTDHWEKLGVASLALMWTFIGNCPQQESTLEARQLTGESALISWRRLPKNFHPLFEQTMLEVWRKAPQGNVNALGGRLFQILAKTIGVYPAAWVLRQLQRPDYATICTMSQAELNALMGDLTKLKEARCN
jgi:hypothetical protein